MTNGLGFETLVVWQIISELKVFFNIGDIGNGLEIGMILENWWSNVLGIGMIL